MAMTTEAIAQLADAIRQQTLSQAAWVMLSDQIVLPHLMMPKALLQHLPLLLYQMLRHHKLQLAQGDWCRSQRSIEHFTDSAESEHYNTEQVESIRHDTSKAQPGLYFLSDIGQLLMSLYIMLLVLPWYVCIQPMRRSGGGRGGHVALI